MSGLLAGVIFACAEVLAAVAMGQAALVPFRWFASLVLGRQAIDVSEAGTVFIVGMVLHLILSAIFGIVYGVLVSGMTPSNRESAAKQALVGFVFGAALWLVNFQVIARLTYPWLLDPSQVVQVILHAAAFGLPLGIVCAAAERQAPAVEAGPVPHPV